MITICCPLGCVIEREYVVSWLFGEVLGLPHRLIEDASKTEWELSVEGVGGRLFLSDAFFSCCRDTWLTADSLPSLPFLETSDDESGLPVIWGGTLSEEKWFLHSDDESRCGIDLIGSLFFLISRYEEAVVTDRDEHDRFPSTASVMGKAGLLSRAVGNEYIEMLWKLMTRVWPSLKRKEREFRVLPSHDIDHPSAFWSQSLRTRLRIGKESLKKGRLLDGILEIAEGGIYPRLGWKHDPFDIVDWMMDQSEAEGLASAFYYIPEKTHGKRDRGMPINHPQIVDQWKRIAKRGHEIGVHPGYDTFRNSERIRSGAELIRNQLSDLGIHQLEIGGRQHYLKWDAVSTPRAWNDAELDYDSSLGFADRIGFRCGVCYEFPLFDLKQRVPLKVRERPLVAMECSAMSPQYMNLGASEDALEAILAVKRECQRFRGDFTILWHNTNLLEQQHRDLYSSILKSA